MLARKLTGPNGEFLGAIGRGIEPATFTKFFQSVALGQDATIAMHHRDGTLLARHPHVEEMIGRNFKTGPAHQQALFDKEHGSSRLASPMDGRDRLVAARTLANFPIVIMATTTVATALADWQEQIFFLVIVTGLFVLVIAALLFAVVRKLSLQHRASQQRLQLEKQRLDTAVNNMTQGLLLFDSSQRLVICNQRYIDMYGLSTEVVKPGCSFRDIIAHRKATGSFVGDDDKYYVDTLRDIAQRNVNVIEPADGRSIQIINEPLADGGWVATHEDVTERKQAEARITHLAHYDALTDLPNRTLFHDRLKGELATLAAGEQFAVLYLDIDEFKSVNDSLGHLIGDELLKSVSVTLRRCIGPTNFVARLGGDEFAIIQTAIKTVADVTELVARVFDAIRQPYECLGHQVTTDASIGIAVAPQHGADFDQILKNADLAMYAAKAAGRRTHRFFEPEMDARVKARRSLEMDLRQAIADGAFEVQYQPCVRLRDNSISGCEALLRWRHPERGVISPAEFIPIAEDTGLINQLGEWVLTTACVEAATLARRYQHRGQRFAGPVQERHLRVEGPGCPCRLRAAGEPAGAGDHRSGPDPRRRGRTRHPASVARHRRAHRARRFRHRLFLAELPAQIPVRQDQDRPQLHQRHRRGRRHFQHRQGGGGHRRGPQHDHDGGRRRDRAATRNAARARLLRNAGLAVQPGEDRRRHPAAVLRAPRKPAAVA